MPIFLQLSRLPALLVPRHLTKKSAWSSSSFTHLIGLVFAFLFVWKFWIGLGCLWRWNSLVLWLFWLSFWWMRSSAQLRVFCLNFLLVLFGWWETGIEKKVLTNCLFCMVGDGWEAQLSLFCFSSSYVSFWVVFWNPSCLMSNVLLLNPPARWSCSIMLCFKALSRADILSQIQSPHTNVT